jgi:hypothetical protein
VDALVPNECSILEVFDSFGDGINAPGGIEVTIDGVVQYQGGDHAAVESNGSLVIWEQRKNKLAKLWEASFQECAVPLAIQIPARAHY